MTHLKIAKIEESLGVILPKDVLERLSVQVGDAIYLVQTPGGYLVTSDPDFAEEMHLAEEGSRRYENALRKLAK